MLRPSLSQALLPLVLALAAGCKEVPRTQVDVKEEVVERTPKTIYANQFGGGVALKGSILTVRAEPICSIVEMETVETTTIYEKQEIPEDEKVWMGALGGVSTLPLGGGIALLVDAPEVHDENPNARLYNPSGQDAAIGGGVALVIVGAAMAIPPIVNAFRYVGGEEETKTNQRQGQTLRTGATCGGVAGSPGASITARAGGGVVVSLGSSSTTARLTFDFKQHAQQLLNLSPVPVNLGIYANESFLGEVRVAELIADLRKERAEQDDLTWQASEPGACESQRTEASCQGVRRYLASFPTGRHAQEANALIAKIRTAVQATPAPQPAPQPQPGGPVIATDPGKAKLEEARKAAQEAAAKAAQEAEKKRQEEEAARAKKAAEEALKSQKRACLEACVKTCGKDQTCRTSCEKEVCK